MSSSLSKILAMLPQSTTRNGAQKGVAPRYPSSAELRHNLLAQQADRVQHPLVRDQAAAIEFGQDAVEADLFAQFLEAAADALRRADQHVALKRVGIGQVAQSFGAVDEILSAGSPRRLGDQLILQPVEMGDALLGLGARLLLG